jgi:hypothetical protein
MRVSETSSSSLAVASGGDSKRDATSRVGEDRVMDGASREEEKGTFVNGRDAVLHGLGADRPNASTDENIQARATVQIMVSRMTLCRVDRFLQARYISDDDDEI